MATEKTRLLSPGHIVDIPNDFKDYDILDERNHFKSLSLEELMVFQDDPWWQYVRRTFFFSFWITLLITFTCACILSVLRHGTCDILKYGIISTSTSNTVLGPILSNQAVAGAT